MRKFKSILSAFSVLLLSSLPAFAMEKLSLDDEPKTRTIPSLLDLATAKISRQIIQDFHRQSLTTLQEVLSCGLSLELICKPIEPTTLFNPRKISVFLKEEDKLFLKVGSCEDVHLCGTSGKSENGLSCPTFYKLLNILKDPNNKRRYEMLLEEETKGNVNIAHYLRNQIAQNLTQSDWVNLTEYTEGLGYSTYPFNEINEIIFSQEFSFDDRMFRDENIYMISEIISLGAYLTNIKLSRLNLERLLQTESAAKGRLQALLQGPSLKSLDLSRNDLRQDFLNVLQKLSGLTKLNVECNYLDSLNLERFPNLTNLNASWNGLKNLLPYSCLYPQNIKWNLTILNVSYNSSINTYHFGHFTALTDLDMSYCKLRKVKDLSSLTNLTNLNLEENELGEKMRARHFDMEQHVPGENMSILATLTNLTRLNLARNGVNNHDIIALEPLLKKGTTTIYFGKDKSENPIITGPHPELFGKDTQ